MQAIPSLSHRKLGPQRRTSALAAILLLLSTGPLAAQRATATADGPQLAQMLREHRYADVLAQCNLKLKATPGSASLWFYRGLAQNGLGHSAQALQDIRHALKADPKYLQAAEAGAQIAYRDHDAQAQSFLQDVVRLEPANRTAHAMLAVLALEKPDCALAVTHFTQAGDVAASDASTASRIELCRAQLSADAGDLATAELTLIALHASNPQNATVAASLAELQLQQKQAGKAVAILAPLRASLSTAALNLLASAQAQQGDVAAAVNTYRESIQRAPQQEDSYLDLAILSMEHQSPEVAMSVLDAGLKARPQSARLLVARGTVYAQIGKDELAQKDFEQADRLAPNSTYGALGMGVLLREDGNLDEAEAVLEKKLLAQPNNPLLEYMLADVLVRKGASPGDAQFTRAGRLLHTAIQAQPSLAQAHALLGKLLLKDGHPDQAIPELEAANKLQPNDRTALNQLVAAYRRVGRTADAGRVSATLEAGMAAERAEENDRNRIHLSLSNAGTSAPANAGAKQP